MWKWTHLSGARHQLWNVQKLENRYFLNRAHSSAKWKIYTHSCNTQQGSANNLNYSHITCPLLKNMWLKKPNTLNTLCNTLDNHSAASGTSPCICTIPCRDCFKFYISKTGRAFKKRLSINVTLGKPINQIHVSFIYMKVISLFKKSLNSFFIQQIHMKWKCLKLN